ncbi:molybdenum cofactor synthesis 3 [Auricularia subglabra TFB-10046 SS5]|nr:molybdenum cofactor synthesis 3 [Auricularia subglabra TFB-10046 SS5]
MDLTLSEYQRYGRQLVLHGFGLPAQRKLKAASVAVVGAGGLGCPALQYLAAAGVGRLGIIDHDVVEFSNLQRQVLHNENTANMNMPKAESAALALRKVNSSIKLDVRCAQLDSTNARSLLDGYDIILDCTDNAPTRYLISDTAVALGVALVSGAALGFDGQLCVYNLGADGPCYRCLFPAPPTPTSVRSCSEAGVLGVVTGTIGTLQALEAIKIITGLHEGRPSLLLFSALAVPPFRSIKLRTKSKTCAACGDAGQNKGSIEETDYVQFCGGPTPDYVSTGLTVSDATKRVSVKDLRDAIQEGHSRVLDVRPRVEYGICSLPGSANVPLSELVSDPASHLGNDERPLYVVCRLGNDSQIAADALRSVATEGSPHIVDVIGGLRSWSKTIDQHFPVY